MQEHMKDNPDMQEIFRNILPTFPNLEKMFSYDSKIEVCRGENLLSRVSKHHREPANLLDDCSKQCFYGNITILERVPNSLVVFLLWVFDNPVRRLQNTSIHKYTIMESISKYKLELEEQKENVFVTQLR